MSIFLRVPNSAGLQSVLVAESAFTVDRTPPAPGRVYDGSIPSLDARFQESRDVLCVNWAEFGDPHTGLGRIEWSIGECVPH